MTQRIKGALGERMIDAALKGLVPEWDWNSGNYKLGQHASDWRRGMRRGLEAAFDELLKEPET